MYTCRATLTQNIYIKFVHRSHTIVFVHVHGHPSIHTYIPSDKPGKILLQHSNIINAILILSKVWHYKENTPIALLISEKYWLYIENISNKKKPILQKH